MAIITSAVLVVLLGITGCFSGPLKQHSKANKSGNGELATLAGRTIEAAKQALKRDNDISVGLDDVNVEFGESARSAKFSDITAKISTDIYADNIEINDPLRTLTYEVTIPSIKVSGRYNLESKRESSAVRSRSFSAKFTSAKVRVIMSYKSLDDEVSLEVEYVDAGALGYNAHLEGIRGEKLSPEDIEDLEDKLRSGLLTSLKSKFVELEEAKKEEFQKLSALARKTTGLTKSNYALKLHQNQLKKDSSSDGSQGLSIGDISFNFGKNSVHSAEFTKIEADFGTYSTIAKLSVNWVLGSVEYEIDLPTLSAKGDYKLESRQNSSTSEPVSSGKFDAKLINAKAVIVAHAVYDAENEEYNFVADYLRVNANDAIIAFFDASIGDKLSRSDIDELNSELKDRLAGQIANKLQELSNEQ